MTEPRTPSLRERRWSRVLFGLAVVVAIVGAIVGGESSAIFFLMAAVPFCVAIYMRRGSTSPPFEGGV